MQWNWRAEMMCRGICRVDSVQGRRVWGNGDKRQAVRADRNLRIAARFYARKYALIMVASLIARLVVGGLTAIFMPVMSARTTGFNGRCATRLQTVRVRMMQATPARHMREHQNRRNRTHHTVHDRIQISEVYRFEHTSESRIGQPTQRGAVSYLQVIWAGNIACIGWSR